MNRATLALFFLFTARKKVLTGLSENGILYEQSVDGPVAQLVRAHP